MKEEILERVIINESTGSSWLLKRFTKLQVIVTTKTAFKNIMPGKFFFSCRIEKNGFH